MDYLDELDKKEEKEKFKKNYNKNQKILRIVMSSVFSGLGILFLLLSIVMFFIEMTATVFYVFLGIGSLYLILGIIFFLTLGKGDADKAYKRIEDRISNGKLVYSTYEMSHRIIMLETKVKKLEEELESIKRNSRY